MEIGEIILNYGVSGAVVAVFLYSYLKQNENIVKTLNTLTETCNTIKFILTKQTDSEESERKDN